jgi:hypothetical protein
METKVLTPEELKALKDLQFKQDQLIVALGNVEYRMTLLEKQKLNLKIQIEDLEKSNLELGAQLTEKYGNGNLNLETGEIITE